MSSHRDTLHYINLCVWGRDMGERELPHSDNNYTLLLKMSDESAVVEEDPWFDPSIFASNPAEMPF